MGCNLIALHLFIQLYPIKAEFSRY